MSNEKNVEGGDYTKDWNFQFTHVFLSLPPVHKNHPSPKRQNDESWGALLLLVGLVPGVADMVPLVAPISGRGLLLLVG